MADPTTWSELLNSFFSKGLPGGTAIDQIPPLDAVTTPRWTKAYWNFALGQDPWKGQWVTRYDDGRGLSRTAGITMLGADESGPDGKDSAWPKLNMGSFHVIQALAGSGTDVTSLPSFTHTEQQLKAAIQYFNNFHIGIDQWRAKMDAPETGWKGSASSAFADVLLRLSRAFEELNTLTGGPDGNSGYLGAIAQAREGLRSAVNEMQQIYSTWGSQPTWSPAGALQQVLSGLNVDHKDNPGGGQGTTKLTHSEYGELGYIDQQGSWDLVEQHAKDLWLKTAQQYLNGMVGDVHIKLSQAYNGASLALKPVPTSIENAINGGGYGSQTPPDGSKTPPPDGTKTPPPDGSKTPPDGSQTPPDGTGTPPGGTGDGNGVGSDLPPGQTDPNGLGGNGDGTDLPPGQTGPNSLGTGDGTGLGDGNGLGSDLPPGQTDPNSIGKGNGIGDGTGIGKGDGPGGGKDLPPGQTDPNDRNHYVPPYLRNPGNGGPPGSTDLNRKNPYTGYNKGNNNGGKNITYKPPRPGQTDLKRWSPNDIKNYTPPRLSSGNTHLGPGTGTGSGGPQTSSNGASGANGAGGVRGPISTSSSGGKNGSNVPLFPPMANGMGGGKGQENQERERTTWLAEDASVWGTDPELAPTVLGRPGTELFADIAYLGETDEWQPAAGPHGGRPGTSGGGARPGQGGAGESRQGQRDGYGQGSSAQRHG